MEHIVRIKSIESITHNVLHIVVSKPERYLFIPGQATDVAINMDDWLREKRPFTFTCLPENDDLEFVIKTYPAHHGVTNQLLQLQPGNELIISEAFGDIHYKGEGIFIAGGAGITPFISIFRQLSSKNAIGNNKLIFANKTKADIILEEEFIKLLGKNFINVLSDESIDGYVKGYITAGIIQAAIESPNTQFYVCGPPPMMNAIDAIMQNFNINGDRITKEGF